LEEPCNIIQKRDLEHPTLESVPIGVLQSSQVLANSDS